MKIPIPGVSQAEGDIPVNGVDAIAISPDGVTIAFVANLQPGLETDRLYTTTLAGGVINQVATSSEVDDIPAFTPDGQTIVYVDSDGGVDKVHRAPTSGGVGTVVNDLVVSFGFRLGSNGQTVVALTRDGVDDVLRSFPLAGGSVTTLSTVNGQGDADTETFNLSPDGSTVYFATDNALDSANETALFYVPVAGGVPTSIPLTIPADRLSNFDIDTVAFDGTNVVFKADYSVNGENRLLRLPLSGGMPTEIVVDDFPSGSDIDDFVISPDGKTIAFTADLETIGVFEVFVVPIAGGEAIKINNEFTAEAIDLDITGDGVPDISDGVIDSDVLREPLGRSLVWTPDSRQVLYLADGEVNEAYEIYLVDNPLYEAIPGDYNADGLVDAADYTVWRDTLDSTTDLRADGDGNEVVDAGDYTLWSQNYGGPNAAAASASLASAPEPTTLAILLIAAGATATRRSQSGNQVESLHRDRS
ncbi:PEP-CTERM sorting domain-containing protein [Posidoniimonas polymericola]|uniref:PEP-CTERM sorting domain-containing protein n=1 Tax=Posidoniimonas polymericola TaxID=2528002 RepID=UPI0018D35B5A|nr:PEP-CTERM sorting domain-containing protein [Posidoniimonas polymericola]